MRPRHTLPFLLSASLLLASCGGGGGGGSSNPPGGGTASSQVRGALSVVQTGSPILEAEPNDTVAQAHALGELRSGGAFVVLGSITEAGSDQIDGFQVIAPERILVDVTLTGTNAAADLDVLVFDPVGLQPVERFQTASSNESGTFAAQGTFFVVVDSFQGDSEYRLEITACPITAPIAEEEPNDSVANGEYLGTLLPGQEIFVTGDGLGGSSDFVLFAVPEATNVDLACGFGAGDDYDLRIFDATQSLTSPQFVGEFNAPGTTNPEVGSINVPGMTLVAVEVFPFAGVSPWALRISAATFLPSSLALGDAEPAPLSPTPRGSLDEQRLLVRGAAASARMFAESPAASVRGDLIVELDATVALAADLVPAQGGATTDAVPGGPRRVRYPIPAGLDDAEATRYAQAIAASLRGRAGVLIAEPDYWMQPFALQQEERPDDPFYNLQWHYEQIQLPAAWGITQGSNAVRVAVLDTGSAPAQDLVPRTIPGIDMISNAQIAGDGDGIDGDPTDVGDSNGVQPSSFHGAHVAGTIGAATDNGFGVAGVTWVGGVMHVRVLGIGGGSTFDILNGVLYAAGLPNASGQFPAQPAQIQNLSLGGPGFNQAFQNAINDATAAGSLVIAAAGNENSSTPSFPAAYDNVISVAAVDFERGRAPYSNFHPTVDIAAPGGDVSVDRNGDGFADGVLSTKPDDSNNPTDFDSFTFYQGTSMAAPHVAGVAALVLAVDPNLTPAQIGAILTQTATDLGAPGRDDQFGEGLVNAFAAVQAAQGGGGGGGPVLSLASSSVLFDSAVDTRRVGVANIGGGTLAVQTPTVNTTSGGSWLSAARVAIQQPTTTDTSAIDVSVNAAGLADGSYSGTVTIDSNGGTATLSVTLALGQGTGAPDFEVYVLAVEPNELLTLAQDVVSTGGPLGYALGALPAGDYFVVAGTDEDGDGFICDPGEPLCGIFPSLEAPSLVPLGQNQTISGVDFPLEQTSLPAGGAAPAGFRILRRAEAGDGGIR